MPGAILNFGNPAIDKNEKMRLFYTAFLHNKCSLLLASIRGFPPNERRRLSIKDKFVNYTIYHLKYSLGRIGFQEVKAVFWEAFP